MTERTLSELAGAEIVPDMGGDNAWLVRVSEGEYTTINKSAKNTLLLKDKVPVEDTVSHSGIMVDFDLEGDEILLHDCDNQTRVPPEKHEHVLWAVHDEDGDRLNKLFDELYTPTVRQGVIDMLTPRFRRDDSEIAKTEDGWLLNGDILLSWDGSNHPVNVEQTHVVRGSRTKEADEDKEARSIDFDLADDSMVKLPNGTETELTEVEMKFLVSAALILGHEANEFYQDGLTQSIKDSSIRAFTDTKSGLHHGHDMGKHTLDMLGVTDEAIERLWYHEYDHVGVWEMAARRDEFENAPIDVFENAPNTDASKWAKIESTKEKAPIPKSIRSDLEERYE
jgi:hypothetical protein